MVYLVSRSTSNPDIVTVQEGWTTEEDHHRIFGGALAQAIVAQFANILADEPVYDDFIPWAARPTTGPPPRDYVVQPKQPKQPAMTTMTARPSVDPELQDLLFFMPEAPPLNEETPEMIRPYATLPVETSLAGRTVASQEISIASFDGTQIVLTILSPAGADLGTGNAPCVNWVHGGGMVMGGPPRRRRHSPRPRPQGTCPCGAGPDLSDARPPERLQLESPVRRPSRLVTRRQRLRLERRR